MINNLKFDLDPFKDDSEFQDDSSEDLIGAISKNASELKSIDPTLNELYHQYGKDRIKDILYTHFFVAGTDFANFSYKEAPIFNIIKENVKNMSEFDTDLFPTKPASKLYADFSNSFENWKSLEYASIPRYFKRCPSFSNCHNLKSILIPSNIESFFQTEFIECFNLKDVIFEQNKNIQLISWLQFAECKKLETIDLSPCVNLTRISDSSFENCNLKQIKFPLYISILSNNSFKNNSFKTLDLSSLQYLKKIGTQCFQGNKNLSSVIFPRVKNLKIFSSAFAKTNLKLVHLPKNTKFHKTSFPKDCQVICDL